MTRRVLASLMVYAEYEPEKAKSMVVRAFKRNACHMEKTAKELAVSKTTIRKVIQHLALEKTLELIELQFRRANKHHYQVRDYSEVEKKRELTMKRNGTRRGRPAKQ